MSDIPKAREIIADVRAQLLARTISEAAAEAKLARAEQMMHREPMAHPRAATEAQPVGKRKAARIRAYKARYPKKSLLDIALRFRTGIGRVSEAIHGKR